MRRQRRGPALAFCATVLRRPLMMLTKRDWHGAEHLPDSGCVLAVNHISEVDPLMTAHFVYDNGRLPRFLGKSEVFDIRGLGAILRSAGQIPVYRGRATASEAYRAAVDAVRAGECVIMYPEATLTRDPDLWPMTGKSGAARIALETGCPVVPVAQWGAHEILPPYARKPDLLPRKVMRFRAGPPVDLSDVAAAPLDSAALRVATDRILDALTHELAAIRGEEPPAHRWDMRVDGDTWKKDRA